MPKEDTVLEELMGHLGEASRSIRASRRLLLEQTPNDDDPGHLRLLARLSEALDATETASREPAANGTSAKVEPRPEAVRRTSG